MAQIACTPMHGPASPIGLLRARIKSNGNLYFQIACVNDPLEDVTKSLLKVSGLELS
jgi:hypothetical protein